MQKPNLNHVYARLNITDLPSLSDCMSKGGMYALIADTPPTRFPILASCLYAALQDGLPCTIILPEQAETFLERVKFYGQLDTDDALSKGELQVLLCQNDFSKKMFKYGTDTFAAELAHFDTQLSGLLIFDKADELFSLHDITLALAQADILGQWFSTRNITALFCFSRLNEHDASTLQALMDKLAGLVHLVGDRDGLELAFDYWQSPEATIAAKHYPLTTTASGLYKIAAPNLVQSVESEFSTPIAEGEKKFYYMDAQLHSLYQQLPGQWQFVDSLVGMVYATRGSQSATVVLSFEKSSKLRELAETVHTLRLGLGKRACIVIHEKGTSLRYQNEALLLRLGVNLVIHHDVAMGRLPLLLESVKGQIFERSVELNFENALASVLPSALRGYQTPVRFCNEVQNIVQRGETIGIPCTLLIGVPLAEIKLGTLLSSIDLSRAGDLSSSDGECCYLFLNGCPESAILITIERLLGKNIDTVFRTHRFVTRKHEIQSEVDVLMRTAGLSELPDYSATAATPAEPNATTEKNINSTPTTVHAVEKMGIEAKRVPVSKEISITPKPEPITIETNLSPAAIGLNIADTRIFPATTKPTAPTGNLFKSDVITSKHPAYAPPMTTHNESSASPQIPTPSDASAEQRPTPVEKYQHDAVIVINDSDNTVFDKQSVPRAHRLIEKHQYNQQNESSLLHKPLI
jgi:cellulose biosynthesis protein BcsE